MVRTSVALGLFVPLLRRHNIYLRVLAGDGRRFARVFQTTWRRIPLGDRRRLLGYWKAEGPTHDIFLSPEVYLTELDAFPIDNESIVGLASHFGHKLRFRADLVNRMPDAVAEDLIAHELAHAFQAATGIRPLESSNGTAIFSGLNGELWEEHTLEYHADVIAEEWGFDTNSVDRWASMNRER
jgi:hypothetical protein